MSIKQGSLNPGQYYHVFNKSVGGELLFKDEGNYRFFLEKYKKYVTPCAETLAYCLLPTHFHFLIRPLGTDKTCERFETPDKTCEGFKPLVGLADYDSKTLSNKSYEGLKPLAGFDLSKQLSHLFNAYAQAYNKQNNRLGSLFKNRFKRVLITDDQHLRTAIIYIHLNPSHHNIESNFRSWKYSSFNAIAGHGHTLVNKEKALDIFEGTENFIFCHNEKYEFDAGLYFDD